MRILYSRDPWTDTVIVDPSIVLMDTGTAAVLRLRATSGQAPYISPTLLRLLRDGGENAEADFKRQLGRPLGLTYEQAELGFNAWRALLAADLNAHFFSNIDESGEERELYSLAKRWLDQNLVVNRFSVSREIFIEQVALAVALSRKGAFVFARCASPPWFWRVLQKRGFVHCTELTEEDWLRDEVAEKKLWLRSHGLHQLAWAGATFGFIHWIFPDPALIKESVGSAFAISKAIYFDP